MGLGAVLATDEVATLVIGGFYDLSSWGFGAIFSRNFDSLLTGTTFFSSGLVAGSCGA